MVRVCVLASHIITCHRQVGFTQFRIYSSKEVKAEPKQEVTSFPSHSSRVIEIQVTDRLTQADVSHVFAAG